MSNLRDRMLDLRAAHREMTETVKDLTARLAENEVEQARVKAMLHAEAKSEIGGVASSTLSARNTIAQMGTFTMSEAIANLGWDRPRVKKLLDAMMCEKPPVVISAGRAFGQAVFKYAGEPVQQLDPVAEREAAALEKVREWAIAQTSAFTPGEAAAACGMPRASALRALRALQQTGAIDDEGPTQDMPIFRVHGVEIPEVTITAPALSIVDAEQLSKVPEINTILVAAREAGCDITSSNGHHAIEFLDGERVIIPAKPRGAQRMREDKAKLRSRGVNV